MKKALSLIFALAFVLSLSPAGYAGEPEDNGSQGSEVLSADTLSEDGSGSEGGSGGSEGGSGISEGGSGGSEGGSGGSEGGSGGSGGGGETTQPPTTLPPATETNPPTTESHAITKHPTSETVQEGGYAEFVARANNCINIIWHLQSPGGGSDILAQNAPISFPGLVVNGLGSERLALNNIPKELNEWRVRAEFVYLTGNSWSDAAVIYVRSQGLTAPTIQSQPQSANLSQGQTTSLQVSAKSPSQNTTLTYQWYSNTVNSNSNGRAILGATSAAYTPDYVPGTVYYYCAVRSSDGTNISAATKTSCAAVSYPAAATETTAAPTQQTLATIPASAATLASWGVETEEQEQTGITVPIATAPTRTYAKSNSLLVVIVAVIIIIAILGVVAALIILKYYSDRDDTQEPAPRSRRQAPPAKPRGARSARQQPKQPPKKTFSREDDPEWDDLSDLDLSYYLDDEDDL